MFIMFNIIAFFIVTLFAWLYMSVVILLTCGKHLHDCIISLRGEVWAHKTRLTLHFIVKRLNQARKVTSHVFVCLGVSMLPLSTISIVDFGTVPTVWYFGTVPTVRYFGTVPTVRYFGTVPTVRYVLLFICILHSVLLEFHHHLFGRTLYLPPQAAIFS